jgi:hypothetical protein
LYHLSHVSFIKYQNLITFFVLFGTEWKTAPQNEVAGDEIFVFENATFKYAVARFRVYDEGVDEMVVGSLEVVRYIFRYFLFGNMWTATYAIEYLYKDPVCNYQWVASSNGETVKNAVKFKPDVFISKKDFNGSIHVGKVTPTKGSDICEGSMCVEPVYDILVCNAA